MFSYFPPVNNNNVNGLNWVEFQFDQIIVSFFVNTQETFQRMKYKRIFLNLTEFRV
jgi:hypothetical protein